MKVDTLQNLNVKPGDVVECVNSESRYFTTGKYYDISVGGKIACDDGGKCFNTISTFRIFSRESDKPKTWGEMTDEEKKVSYVMSAIEYIDESFDSDLAKRMRDELGIKPDPVRDTVELQGVIDSNNPYFERKCDGYTYTHRITFDTIDGEPDCGSVKMEKI